MTQPEKMATYEKSIPAEKLRTFVWIAFGAGSCIIEPFESRTGVDAGAAWMKFLQTKELHLTRTKTFFWHRHIFWKQTIADEYFYLRKCSEKWTIEWLRDLLYSILSGFENKWHRCQKLRRTNYKAVALFCVSPCEKLHYIALYCTCSSDCILLYAESLDYCILLYSESLKLKLFYYISLMEY